MEARGNGRRENENKTSLSRQSGEGLESSNGGEKGETRVTTLLRKEKIIAEANPRREPNKSNPQCEKTTKSNSSNHSVVVERRAEAGRNERSECWEHLYFYGKSIASQTRWEKRFYPRTLVGLMTAAGCGSTGGDIHDDHSGASRDRFSSGAAMQRQLGTRDSYQRFIQGNGKG